MTDLTKLTAEELMSEIRYRLEKLEEAEADLRELLGGHWCFNCEHLEWKAKYEETFAFYEDLRKQHDVMRERMEKCEAALKIYANRDNWECSRKDEGPIDMWICCDEDAWNGPHAARAALEE